VLIAFNKPGNASMSSIAARRYAEMGRGSARRIVGVSGALSVHLLLLLSWFAQTDGLAALPRRPMPFGAEHGSPVMDAQCHWRSSAPIAFACGQ
jgi:hypothetical protein